jgi:catechol 2,3-dioxygenase-like lactoylglutathione lyase family enzyme
MIGWYHTVFGAHIVHEDSKLAFLTWDEESHRLALVKLPRLLRYLFPLARLRRKVYGVDHLGFSVRSLEQLLSTYERLKKAGITPVWSINHGPTTSLYYEDPDGIRLEFQTENLPTASRHGARAQAGRRGPAAHRRLRRPVRPRVPGRGQVPAVRSRAADPLPAFPGRTPPPDPALQLRTHLRRDPPAGEGDRPTARRDILPQPRVGGA